MTYSFDSTPEQASTALFDHLRRAQEGGPEAERESAAALVSLVRLQVEPGAPLQSIDLRIRS